MENIKIRLRPTGAVSLFHDSRGDARVCVEAINCYIQKINELVETVNALELAQSLNGEGKQRNI